MGRNLAVKIISRFQSALAFMRSLLEGRREESVRAPWALDASEKVLTMWPEISSPDISLQGATGTRKKMSDAVFSHLRRLYRYGFRLSLDADGARIRQFFADGELYRPEGYSRESEALLADLEESDLSSVLRVGQCKIARARPVLKALGFPDLDTTDAYAIQFAWIDGERWIFIDSRPEVFRRDTAAVIANRLAETERVLPRPQIEFHEGPSL